MEGLCTHRCWFWLVGARPSLEVGSAVAGNSVVLTVLRVCTASLNWSKGPAGRAHACGSCPLVTEMAKARSGRGTCHTASPDASQFRSDSRSLFSSSNSHTSEALSGPLLHYPYQAALTSQSAYCMPTLTTMTETKQVTMTNVLSPYCTL